MRPDDPNYEYLLLIAEALGDLRDNVVFVGGCTAGLLLTDSAAEGIRATKDVDAIVEAATLRQYYKLESCLPALGFVRDTDNDVICRWRHAATGVLFDLMPTDAAILGFSNRWYPEAARTATRVRLNDRIEIRRIAAPAFVATKLEAFVSRGQRDFLSSHDLEDVLTVVDGRPSIVDELRVASLELRQFVRETVGALLSEPRFEDYLPGLLADSSWRKPTAEERNAAVPAWLFVRTCGLSVSKELRHEGGLFGDCLVPDIVLRPEEVICVALAAFAWVNPHSF